ncbi:hypothetical protein BH09ACT3_BH09ACT3_03660 [soil metagenome]
MDAARLMDANDRVREADAARGAAGRFRRRGAERIRLAAEQDRTVIETAVRDRWGSAPSSLDHAPAWAEAVAGRRADADRQVVEAGQAAERAQQDAGQLAARQMGEREQLRRAIYREPYSRVSAKSRAEGYTRRAANDRRLLAQLEALPPEQAAALIRERAEAERIAAALAERGARTRTPARDPRRPSPSTRPDFGPSL